MRLSAVRYYATSAVALLTRFQDPLRIARSFAMRRGGAGLVRLRAVGSQPPLRFYVRDAMDVWIVMETCVHREYEPEGARIQPDWHIVDIGAGVGDFAVHAARHAPRGVVHAYEPLAASADLCRRNVTLNQAHNVTVFTAAVAATTGAARRQPGATAAVSTRFDIVPTTAPAAETPAAGLDTVLDRLPRGAADLLKIDCEGGEFDIILGSEPATLRRCRRIALEYHDGFTPHTHRDLSAHLSAAGFEVVHRPNPVHTYLGHLFAVRRADIA